MAGLRLEDFCGFVGETWQVDAAGTLVPLRLEAAQSLPGAIRAEGGFRLEWAGPPEPLLAQGVYPFSRDGAACEIFIVPIARDADGILRYEAIFS